METFDRRIKTTEMLHGEDYMKTGNEFIQKLVHIETEDELVALLDEFGFWNNREAWRNFGDVSDNQRTVGNQQADGVAALTEKITNSQDSILMAECEIAGIDPTGDEAPSSLREAVAILIEGRDGRFSEKDGSAMHWTENGFTQAFLTEQAKKLYVLMTGKKKAEGYPTISVIDMGEGQSPSNFDKSFMKLGSSNKENIAFTHGRWGMGSTGVFPFCSKEHKFQIVISRRHPKLLKSDAIKNDHNWGCTVVMRRRSGEGEKNSVWQYLAPIGCEEKPFHGGVLEADLKTLPLIPDEKDDRPFVKEVEHGTMIKMIEYQLSTGDLRGAGNGRNGLYRNLNLQMPECHLPIRFSDTRRVTSSSGGWTNGVGSVYSIIEQAKATVDIECDLKGSITVQGESIPIRALLMDRNAQWKTYLPGADNGVVFSINGQKHACKPKAFFGRKAVSLGAMKDHLYVLVDLTEVHKHVLEELVMTSRDRLMEGDFANEMEAEIESFLKNNRELKDAHAEWREKDATEGLQDDAEVEKLFNDILKANPLLADVINFGSKIKAPFDDRGNEKGDLEDFVGSYTPSFFRFRKGSDQGKLTYAREIEAGKRTILQFETDAVDDYLERAENQGNLIIEVLDGEKLTYTQGSLYKGALNVTLAAQDEIQIGKVIRIRFGISDDMLINALPICEAELKVIAPHGPSSAGTTGKRTVPNVGKGIKGSRLFLEIPHISKKSHIPGATDDEGNSIYMEDWDEYTAMTVAMDGGKAESLFWNEGNKFFRHALDKGKDGLKASYEFQFKFGLAFFVLAYIEHLDKEVDKLIEEKGKQGEDEIDIPTRVEQFTRAIGTLIIPTIGALGKYVPLDEEE